MPTSNPITFLGQNITLETSPFGQIVNTYYLDGANDTNPDVVKLAADVNGSVVASKFHMDYTKVLEDSLTDKFGAIDVAIAGAGSAPSLTAIYRLDTNVDPTVNLTMRTLVAKVQLLEHFCLLLNQGLRLSNGGLTLPQTAGQVGSLPFCINQITQSEPALEFDLSVQSYDCPPISPTLLSSLAVPDDATAYTGTNINFADIALGALSGYTVGNTYSNGIIGYSIGTFYSNTMFNIKYDTVDFSSMKFLFDEIGSSGKNLAKIMFQMTKSLVSAPNKLFTSAGYFITFQALSGGSSNDFTVNPQSLYYNSVGGEYSMFKTEPFPDPSGITGNVRVVTGYANTAILPLTESGLTTSMMTEEYPGANVDSHSFSYTSITGSGLIISINANPDPDLNPVLNIVKAIKNSYTLTGATIVITDAGSNDLTLTLTNTLPLTEYTRDGWLSVTCTGPVLTAVAAAAGSGFDVNSIVSVTYNV